eukprot:scaffold41750_cov40-Cyclotella_meneghiniana.AAC.1
MGVWLQVIERTTRRGAPSDIITHADHLKFLSLNWVCLLFRSNQSSLLVALPRRLKNRHGIAPQSSSQRSVSSP